MNESDQRILEKIASEISYLEGLVSGMDMKEFVADETVKRAASMASINIGELAKHLSSDFYEQYPDSELRLAAKTRDVYAHGYFTLSFETVYKTAVEDYPRVLAWIQGILSSG